jgi:ribosome maturation factor RimP
MIPQQETIDKISSAVLPILRESSLDLVDVEFVSTGRRWLLRIYIDKEGGISIRDCEWVSREFGRLLEAEDIIDHPYVLEVSSPGLTRPLRKWQDFDRYVGKRCKIITREVVDGKNEFKGEIIDASTDDVAIKVDGVLYRILLSVIKKANLEFEL